MLSTKQNTKYFLIIGLISLLISLTLIFLLIKYLFSGLDYSDEGYYLINIINPWLYDSVATLFGFIYHFLFDILNQNISYLRLVNFLIIFILSFIFSYFILKLFFSGDLLKNTFLFYRRKPGGFSRVGQRSGRCLQAPDRTPPDRGSGRSQGHGRAGYLR